MTSNDVYRNYSRFYDDYNDDFFEDLDVYRCSINDKDVILEVGCGSGRVTKELLDINPKLVLGVDISNEMLLLCKSKLLNKIKEQKLVLYNHNFLNGPISEEYRKVFITYFTINYITDNLMTFLNNIYINHLIGGEIIIDCFIPDVLNFPELNGVERQFEPFYSNGDKYYVKDLRTLNGDFETRNVIFDNKKDDCVEMNTIRKYYSPNEMSSILYACGYRDIKWIYGYGKKKEKYGNYLIRAKKY